MHTRSKVVALVVALALFLTGCIQVVVEPTPTPRPTRSVPVARYSADAVVTRVMNRYTPFATNEEAALALAKLFSACGAKLERDGVWSIGITEVVRGRPTRTTYWEYYEGTDEVVAVHELARNFDALLASRANSR